MSDERERKVTEQHPPPTGTSHPPTPGTSQYWGSSSEQPPRDTGTGGTGDTDAKRASQEPPKSAPKSTPPRSSRRGKLGQLENRLNEMMASAAVAQSSLALLTQDGRHMAGAEVTSTYAPSLVSAWVKLAEENDAVYKVLSRMTEGSAWGEVILATGTFAYFQAQAYGVAPELPFESPFKPPTPPSAEGMAHAAANGETPFHGRTAEDARSGVDAEQDPAHNEAERQRRMVEERRKARGS